MNPKLADIELSMACEVIASTMGLHFPIERWAMLRRNLALASREFGFQNMRGFIQWLLSATLNKDQIEIIASYLAISETYFWREPKVFTAITDFILPELIKSKKNTERNMRIWSAGCSTGEEAYSIAIALHKTIQNIEDWNIIILATDINPVALGKAVSGIYGKWSFRNSPSWLISNYFNHKDDRKYEIIPEIKKLVTFSCNNLIELSAESNTGTVDVIFCRNVLMYFTHEWAARVSQNFFHSLSEDGWLVVSSCELSSHLFPQFTPVNFPGAVLYCKNNTKSIFSFPVHSDEIPEPIKQNLHSVQLLQPLQPFTLSTLQQPPASAEIPEKSINDKILAIRLLANQGYLDEALSICNEVILSCKLEPGLYFLRASILQEMDKISEAIASLRQTIYIDQDYLMGHFTLGNLFILQGRTRDAKRYFKNVLDLLSGCANDDIVPKSEGLSVKYIREIVSANMQI